MADAPARSELGGLCAVVAKMTFSRSGPVVAALLGLSAVGHGQDPVRYGPAPDTVAYEATNSYLLYFLQGADTLGQGLTTRALERHLLRKSGRVLELSVTLDGLGSPSFHSEEVFTVTPSGRVLLVDGAPPGAKPHGRVDVLPRLPEAGGPLKPGDRWLDTVSTTSSASYGPTAYSVRRNYRVVQAKDTLGARVLLFVAEGQMRLRHGGWQDSIQGLRWWLEAEGPVVDSVWFDAGAGRLVRNVTFMDLAGDGGVGTPDQTLRLRGGLRSSIHRARVSEARARELLRQLPEP